MTYIENAVPLKELAAVTKGTVAQLEAEARELGMFLGEDWAGRRALAEGDARQLMSGEARRVREDAAEWAAHLADCAAWTAGRDAAVRLAHAENIGDGRRGPAGDSAAREAAIDAGRRYEETTPVPLWLGAESGNAVRAYSAGTAGSPGLLARTVGRVKAGVR